MSQPGNQCGPCFQQKDIAATKAFSFRQIKSRGCTDNDPELDIFGTETEKVRGESVFIKYEIQLWSGSTSRRNQIVWKKPGISD